MYCTRQDLIERFGERELVELTDRDGSRGVIVDEILAQAMTDAAGEIDGYFGTRYSVPLATVPKAIQRIACDLARYYLYDDEAPKQVAQRHEDAVRFLRAIARGEVSVGPSESGERPVTTDGASITSGGRIFGRNDNGFI
jgi:phage gp36-like protein